MRKALAIINKSKSVSHAIQISLPITNSTLDFDNYDYVIFDTPGSNSATFKEHFDVLKKAMNYQTNGLPIFISKADQTDDIDNVRLISDIKQMGARLDRTNLLILINQADDGKMSDRITQRGEIQKLDPAGVLLLSAVIGLAYKKKQKGEELIDDGYIDVYEDRWDKFEKPTKKNYTQLYKFNYMPAPFQAEYNDECQTASSSELVYRNCGLHCVESYIRLFADKYALYNKCHQACLLLSEAIKILRDLISTQKTTEQKNVEEFQRQLDKEKATLISQIKQEIEILVGSTLESVEPGSAASGDSASIIPFDEKKTFAYSFENMANNAAKDCWPSESELAKKITDIWEAAKQKAWKEKQDRIKKSQGHTFQWIIEIFSSHTKAAKVDAIPDILQYANGIGKVFQERLNSDTITVCDTWDRKLKEKCYDIIYACEGLDEKQRTNLKEKMEDVDLLKPEEFKITFDNEDIFDSILWFSYLSGTAPKKCKDAIVKEMRKSRSDYIKDATRKYRKFAKNILQEVRRELSKMSPILKDIQDNIESSQSKIEEYGNSIDIISRHILYIKTKLMGGDFHEE